MQSFASVKQAAAPVAAPVDVARTPPPAWLRRFRAAAAAPPPPPSFRSRIHKPRCHQDPPPPPCAVGPCATTAAGCRRRRCQILKTAGKANRDAVVAVCLTAAAVAPGRAPTPCLRPRSSRRSGTGRRRRRFGELLPPLGFSSGTAAAAVLFRRARRRLNPSGPRTLPKTPPAVAPPDRAARRRFN